VIAAEADDRRAPHHCGLAGDPLDHRAQRLAVGAAHRVLDAVEEGVDARIGGLGLDLGHARLPQPSQSLLWSLPVVQLRAP
jgi:hypothetical protein